MSFSLHFSASSVTVAHNSCVTLEIALKKTVVEDNDNYDEDDFSCVNTNIRSNWSRAQDVY